MQILIKLANKAGQDPGAYIRQLGEVAAGFTEEGFLRLFQLFVENKHVGKKQNQTKQNSTLGKAYIDTHGVEVYAHLMAAAAAAAATDRPRGSTPPRLGKTRTGFVQAYDAENKTVVCRKPIVVQQ